jgi:hypothetical protein
MAKLETNVLRTLDAAAALVAPRQLHWGCGAKHIPGFFHLAIIDGPHIDRCGHVDDDSQAYLPCLDKERGKLMSLNLEAVKG